MASEYMTVGQLAQRVGLRSSALRFYEEQKLLLPTSHSEAGYRLYDETAESTLRFIIRAQHLGFSLADIREILNARENDQVDDSLLLSIAEARYIALERQITPLLVQRHELAHLLQDVRENGDPNRRPRLDNLIERICTDPMRQPAETTLARLLEITACRLTSEEGQALISNLRGCHVHVWHNNDTYDVLVVGQDPKILTSLTRLMHLEADCRAHTSAQPKPEISTTPEGYRLSVRGDNAFLYARLFMAIEDPWHM